MLCSIEAGHGRTNVNIPIYCNLWNLICQYIFLKKLEKIVTVVTVHTCVLTTCRWDLASTAKLMKNRDSRQKLLYSLPERSEHNISLPTADGVTEKRL